VAGPSAVVESCQPPSVAVAGGIGIGPGTFALRISSAASDDRRPASALPHRRYQPGSSRGFTLSKGSRQCAARGVISAARSAWPTASGSHSPTRAPTVPPPPHSSLPPCRMAFVDTMDRPKPRPFSILPKPGPLSSTTRSAKFCWRPISTVTVPDGPAARVALLSRFAAIRRRRTGWIAAKTGSATPAIFTSPGQVTRSAATTSLTTRHRSVMWLPDVPGPAVSSACSTRSASHSACSTICSRRARAARGSAGSVSAAPASASMLATGWRMSWHVSCRPCTSPSVACFTLGTENTPRPPATSQDARSPRGPLRPAIPRASMYKYLGRYQDAQGTTKVHRQLGDQADLGKRLFPAGIGDLPAMLAAGRA